MFQTELDTLERTEQRLEHVESEAERLIGVVARLTETIELLTIGFMQLAARLDVLEAIEATKDDSAFYDDVIEW